MITHTFSVSLNVFSAHQARSQVVCWGGCKACYKWTQPSNGVAKIIHVCMVGYTLPDAGLYEIEKAPAGGRCMQEGWPPAAQLGDMGECCKLPHWGLRWSPRSQGLFNT